MQIVSAHCGLKDAILLVQENTFRGNIGLVNNFPMLITSRVAVHKIMEQDRIPNIETLTKRSFHIKAFKDCKVLFDKLAMRMFS